MKLSTKPLLTVTEHGLLAMLCATLLLVSCATNTSTSKKTTSILDNQAESQSVERASGLDTKRPATALRIKAAKLIDTGEIEPASRLLERALRVDARDPATYYEFARLRYVQGELKRAQQLSEKGKSLRPDSSLRKKFNQLEMDLKAAEKSRLSE